jgi:hypothetical protein
MRLLTLTLLIFGGLAAFGVSGTRAQVPDYPWCIIYSGDEADGGVHCMFVSYAQCMMTATPGSGASCVRNLRNDGPGTRRR